VDGGASADGSVVVFAVVCLQESSNLLCEEREEFFAGLGDHELAGNGDLGLGEGEGAVTVEVDGADTEVGATEVDSHVETLFTSELSRANWSSSGSPSRFRWEQQSRRWESGSW
jgi:hypothetical protein